MRNQGLRLRFLCTTWFSDCPGFFHPAPDGSVVQIFSLRAPAQMSWVDADRVIAVVARVPAVFSRFAVRAFANQIACRAAIGCAVAVDRATIRPWQTVIAVVCKRLQDEGFVRAARDNIGVQWIAIPSPAVAVHAAKTFGVMWAAATRDDAYSDREHFGHTRRRTLCLA